MDTNYPEITDILARFEEGWIASIDTPDAWLPHIVACHKELLAIDPDYTLLQVKEKWGGLRYYFNASRPELQNQMQNIVYKYEFPSEGWEWGHY